MKSSRRRCLKLSTCRVRQLYARRSPDLEVSGEAQTDKAHSATYWATGFITIFAGAGASLRRTWSSAVSWKSTICRCDELNDAADRLARSASPGVAARNRRNSELTVAKTLLDFMRVSLPFKVTISTPSKQETIQQQSSQRLIAPWALDEQRSSGTCKPPYPRSTRQSDFGGDVFVYRSA